ncbi:peptidase [Arenicella chitinivorans]|uniref:Peptidase n=1 Tax=Arenicella chitinivorans TaxID=1329800 RepID=A0A918VPF2_9GAMM|nr:SapC family protein [Arenicella chitinivorans]GHA13348.1 peptidase [Arenicella chitinivorans]
MSNFELLNPAQHSDLKVITERSADYGDAVNYVMTFPFEFRNIQHCYPIFFQKDATSSAFFPIALLGFEQNENLFLDNPGWNAPYVPLMIRRQPFLIGYQTDANDPNQRNPMVSIDMDNPRVNETDGEALFLEHGGTSDFLQQATESLELIHQAHEHSAKFMAKLAELELLEAFSMTVKLNNGSENQLLGFYTLNEEKVQNLSGDVLSQLNQQGFLQPLFMVIASHSCVSDLVERKNKQVA